MSRKVTPARSTIVGSLSATTPLKVSRRSCKLCWSNSPLSSTSTPTLPLSRTLILNTRLTPNETENTWSPNGFTRELLPIVSPCEDRLRSYPGREPARSPVLAVPEGHHICLDYLKRSFSLPFCLPFFSLATPFA